MENKNISKEINEAGETLNNQQQIKILREIGLTKEDIDILYAIGTL